MITVFYDGKCRLCAREINYYRKIAPDKVFDWQDITDTAESLNAEGISLSDALRQLHVKDTNGTLHVGVDAFVLIWKQLERWRLLAVFISLPIVRQLARLIYSTFANWRFKRLKHCQLAAKQETSS